MGTTRLTWIGFIGIGGLLASLVTATPSVMAAPAKGAPGKQVFVEHKCNECHTVKVEGVERSKKKKKGIDPPDLSDVGKSRKRDWMQRFLQKKEKIDGKKHKKKFRGDAAEEKALLDWLTSLKSAEKK